VERIWVPFAAWLVAAASLRTADPTPAADSMRTAGPAGAAGTAGSARAAGTRWWLAAQAVTALAVQALILSPW
jgi:hypothetical protein